MLDTNNERQPVVFLLWILHSMSIQPPDNIFSCISHRNIKLIKPKTNILILYSNPLSILTSAANVHYVTQVRNPEIIDSYISLTNLSLLSHPSAYLLNLYQTCFWNLFTSLYLYSYISLCCHHLLPVLLWQPPNSLLHFHAYPAWFPYPNTAKGIFLKLLLYFIIPLL